MEVNLEVAMSEQQDGVVQRELDPRRQEVEAREAERVALRALMRERAEGPFVPLDEGRRSAEAMLAAKRRARGL